MTLVRFQPAPFRSLLHDFGSSTFTQPVVNILETLEGFRIELAVPGFQKDDFQIKLEKDLLTISATKAAPQPEEGVKYLRRDFSFGSFERVFRLPETIDADKLDARFTNGVLQINLLKKPEAQPVVKKIEVA